MWPLDPSATRFPPVNRRRRASSAEARRRLAVPVTGLRRLRTVAGPQLRVLGGGSVAAWHAAGGPQRRRQPPASCREGCCAATSAKNPQLSCTRLSAEQVEGEAVAALANLHCSTAVLHHRGTGVDQPKATSARPTCWRRPLHCVACLASCCLLPQPRRLPAVPMASLCITINN